jgi:fumarylacetoacetase
VPGTFGVDNLPYGVFTPGDGRPRVGVRIGDTVLDLHAALGDEVFAEPTLNAFMAQGPASWQQARERVTALLGEKSSQVGGAAHRHNLGDVSLALPFAVADYVDFYSSRQHAENVGRIFRPDGDALMPNWLHLPIGYHGRAGTVVVSGTPVGRPSGQRREPGSESPVFGPSTRLDIEAEVGFVVGVPSPLGRPIPAADFDKHVFGVALVNDWSARDIQAWEYVPLGPFLGKSFATSISAWVTPLAALRHARVPPPVQEPEPLPYLRSDEDFGLDIEIEVSLNGHVVSRPPFRDMYWSPAQQLAHMTVNGASARTGDLYASGTVSGTVRGEFGSFLEMSWGGRDPLSLPGGETRTFLRDGDTVTLTASARGSGGARVALGEVTGTIMPAVNQA